MNKKIILGTLAYTLVTFFIAIIWHIVLFEDTYISFGYFKGEPNISVGFLTILIQGFVLTYLYNFVSFSGTNFVKSMKYVLTVGLFFWTSHVLAFVAKQNVENGISFILMETFYLLLQFGIYGACIGLIYKNYKPKY
ncbi:hypothetical protein [Flavivirga spongiicola]|uniref:Uncharacterized protein n=1 Tax=Flavivirga spongiicola TaxID=421621 RepID=A0ABU7XTS0_9FLAO|nr:hypothetical protein [Flavivirga sp. MEBiC05379]MDO5978957.1 hypothetical protein [Flavivirga sp. MEBiC05379]